MAVTSLWPVRKPAQEVIAYATDPKKTGGELITCLNCSKTDAARQFLETKRMWSALSGRDKTGGVTCYHGFQAFSGKELSAETAHEIGVKLASRLWGDRYEVVVTTHCDTDNRHNHFVINSVSFTDGKKYSNSVRSFCRMREESDRLCLEYGLPVGNIPDGRRMPYGEYVAHVKGEPTYRSLIRADLERAADASLTEPEFFAVLGEMGYETARIRGRPALRPPGAERFMRFDRLGGFSPEDIRRRLTDNRRRTAPFPESRIEEARAFREETRPEAGARGLYRLYLRYRHELTVLKRYPGCAKKVSFRLREDLIRPERLDAEMRFVADNAIETAEDLKAYVALSEERLAGLTETRKKLRGEKRTAEDTGDREAASAASDRINTATSEMRRIRKALRLCAGIEERSGYMESELGALEAERTGRKEEKDHGRIRGGRGGADRQDEPGRN